MTASSWLEWHGGLDAIRRSRRLEDRASVAFKVVAALNLPGIVLAPLAPPPSTLLAVTSVGATILTMIVYLVEARAIDRRRRWALRAIRPLLLIVVAFGGYSVIVASGEGWLKLPIDVALATWAWLASPEASPPADLPVAAAEPAGGAAATARSRLRSIGIVLAVVALQGVIWYGRPVFGWGGLLDVHPRDLSASLHVDCGPAGTGSPPATLTVSYDWSWGIRPVWPSGLDVVVVAWRGVDGDGRVLYLLGDTPNTGPGIQSGLQDEPSLDLAEQAEAESPGSWHWGLRLDRQAMSLGHIEFTLGLARSNPPEPGPVTITATYVHLGLWRASPPSVSCTW